LAAAPGAARIFSKRSRDSFSARHNEQSEHKSQKKQGTTERASG